MLWKTFHLISSIKSYILCIYYTPTITLYINRYTNSKNLVNQLANMYNYFVLIEMVLKYYVSVRQMNGKKFYGDALKF